MTAGRGTDDLDAVTASGNMLEDAGLSSNSIGKAFCNFDLDVVHKGFRRVVWAGQNQPKATRCRGCRAQ